MDYLDHGNEAKRKIKVFSFLIKYGAENYWISKDEKQSIEAQTTFNGMKKVAHNLIHKMKSKGNAARLFCSFNCLTELYEILNEKGWDEMQFRSLINCKVFEKGLLTVEEKLSFDKELYLKTVEDNQDTIARNPMKIDVIIGCVFTYLNVENIKKCRLISKKWRDIGIGFLKSRARISFNTFARKQNLIFNKDGKKIIVKKEIHDRAPAIFFETFPELSESISFTAFSFTCNGRKFWKIKELTEFFDSYKKNIRELELKDLKFYDDLSSFDISTWISDSPLTTAEPKCNTKLEITYKCEPKKVLKMSCTVLMRVKILKLEYCQVHLMGEKMSPIELDLKGVSFFRNGNKLPTFCINDAFDLSTLKRLTLNGKDYKLDLRESLNLDYLKVTQGMRNAWDISKWIIDKVHCHNLSALKLQNRKISVELNLSWMPKSVKKLSLAGFKVTKPPAGNEVLHLEKLVLLAYSFQDVQTICNMHICSKELVLLPKSSENITKSEVFDIQNSHPAFWDRIYVEDCIYLSSVNGNPYKSEYYLFEKNPLKRTAISQKEFEKNKHIPDN